MSRKDYIRLAKAFNEALTTLTDADDESRAVVRGLAREVASVCAGDNSLFDRSRFLTACGVNP